jgi:predicted restriction endonuclease
MAFDRDFAQALVSVMADAGWETQLPDDELSNPLDITFIHGDTSRRLIIHARRITPQSRSGANPSTHNRPAGEMHLQMIFDGDQRGAGNRNKLRFAANTQTLLLGFYMLNGFVVAAYDPHKHQEYAYSKSLQVKFSSILESAQTGFYLQPRQSDETIVIFPLSELPQYLEYASEFHSLNVSTIDVMEDTPPLVRSEIRRMLSEDELPELKAQERRRAFVEVARLIRNAQFADAIKSVYQRCAICDFQLGHILDAAHIVPVAEGGTDTYDNGLGLCPICHRMFDSGVVLVDENGEISMNENRLEEFRRLNLAASEQRVRSSLRQYIREPDNGQYKPSSENLRRTFKARR